MGCSAVLRLDNISEAEVLGGDDSTKRLRLACVRSTVSRGMPSLDIDSATFELKDMESRCRTFLAALFRAIRSQTHWELAAEELKRQAEGKGGESSLQPSGLRRDWLDSSYDHICKMKTKTRLPMLELFSPSAGATSICAFKPGQQILSSKSEGGLPQLCCIWQGVAIGTMNGITVRRAEFGVSLTAKLRPTSFLACFALQCCVWHNEFFFSCTGFAVS